MDLAAILAPIFSFVLIKMMLDQRAKARADNVRLLEEALKHPTIDRGTLESLTYQLTGSRPPRSPGAPRSTTFMATVLAIGWITLFTGIGILVIGGITGTEEAVAAGAFVGITGFGLVTYPFALRELEARREPQ